MFLKSLTSNLNGFVLWVVRNIYYKVTGKISCHLIVVLVD